MVLVIRRTSCRVDRSARMIVIMSASAFEGLRVRRHEYAPGHVLFSRGRPVRSMHRVVEGLVELVRHGSEGRTLVLQRAGAGAIVAEASLFSATYHCDAVVRRTSVLESVSAADLRSKLKEPLVAEMWLARLSHEVQATRTRAEILSLRTVSERLSAWMDVHGPLSTDRRWVDVAGEIGVSPEALYRELARRRSARRSKRPTATT
ncbi:Crp/Fnr family transcriptional regulator [Alsobacter sp. R-9]